MSDPNPRKPAEQEELWAILRRAEPPPGAIDRVQARVEEDLDRESLRTPRAPRIALALTAAALTAILIALAMSGSREAPSPGTPRAAAGGRDSGQAPPVNAPETPGASGAGRPPATTAPSAAPPTDPADVAGAGSRRARVLAARAASQGGRELVGGEPMTTGPVRVAEKGELRVALGDAELDVTGPDAELDVTGPAAIELRPAGPFIEGGRVEVRGSTWVAGPGCEAEVAGRAEVAVSAGQVQITLFAGTASTAPDQTTCQLLDLTPAGAQRRAAGRYGPRAAAAPSALARQVDAFSAADQLRAADPAAALARLEALRTEWPRSPLRHEIDLAIIDLLVRLGRTDAARAEARQFLLHHPNSPRRDHVARIATED